MLAGWLAGMLVIGDCSHRLPEQLQGVHKQPAQQRSIKQYASKAVPLG